MKGLSRNKNIISVFMLLLILLAWMLGNFFWIFYTEEQPNLGLPALNSKTVRQADVTGVSSPIYLFGRTQSTQGKLLVATVDVQKTRLNLKLLGVLVTHNNGIAIIEKGGKDYTFSLDETIQRGVILKEVHSDYVVISHNGLLEKLQMAQGNTVFMDDDSRFELTEKQLETLKKVKENALKNPISIMRYVRFQMIQKGGIVTAVKIWPRAEKAIFESLGFKEGDVLKTVSGYSVAELAKSPTLWQDVLKKANLDLTIERNGRSQSVLVQLD